MDIATMTPLEALNTLYRLQNKLKNRWRVTGVRENDSMKNIAVLDESTIDKIAAGEVIERPSSVVKELVENAIDAGATAVTVEIKDGGISLIRITDNGEGIAKEQIPTGFSASCDQQDHEMWRICFTVSSLGFRGEALIEYCRSLPGGTDHQDSRKH